MKRIIGRGKEKLLDRDGLLKKEKLEVVQVDLGDGSHVFVREMTGRERDTFERSMYFVTDDDKSKGGVKLERRLGDFRAKLAVCTICDAEGELILKPEDFEQLSMNMSAAKLERIVNVASPLSKISEEDKDALVKNSEAGQAGNSSSDSAES